MGDGQIDQRWVLGDVGGENSGWFAHFGSDWSEVLPAGILSVDRVHLPSLIQRSLNQSLFSLFGKFSLGHLIGRVVCVDGQYFRLVHVLIAVVEVGHRGLSCTVFV